MRTKTEKRKPLPAAVRRYFHRRATGEARRDLEPETCEHQDLPLERQADAHTSPEDPGATRSRGVNRLLSVQSNCSTTRLNLSFDGVAASFIPPA